MVWSIACCICTFFWSAGRAAKAATEVALAGPEAGAVGVAAGGAAGRVTPVARAVTMTAVATIASPMTASAPAHLTIVRLRRHCVKVAARPASVKAPPMNPTASMSTSLSVHHDHGPDRHGAQERHDAGNRGRGSDGHVPALVDDLDRRRAIQRPERRQRSLCRLLARRQGAAARAG